MKTLLFLLFSLSLFANEPSPAVNAFGDPSALIDGKVNAITGDLLFSDVDLVVEAAEPLALTRHYGSGGAGDYWGGWVFFPYSVLRTGAIANERNEVLHMGELSFVEKETKEGMIHYEIDLDSHGFGLTNTSRGAIAGSNNLRNYRAFRPKSPKDAPLTVLTANGTKKIYHKGEGPKYLLKRERLPNGNLIDYSYDESEDLRRVVTRDPTGKREYAWLTFEYEKENNMWRRVIVRTSDEREVQYHFEKKRDKRFKYGYITYLERIDGDVPTQEFAYAKEEGKEIRRIASFSNGREEGGARYHLGRVKALEKKTGESSLPTYMFDYSFPYVTKDKKEHLGKTVAIDLLGKKKEFFYNRYRRPKEIVFSDREKELYREGFIWTELKGMSGNLLQKWLKEKGKILCTRNYRYDVKYNPAVEDLIAYVSSPLQLSKLSTKRVFENNLSLTPFSETTPDQRHATWRYKEGTNLVTRHLSGYKDLVKKREFTEYNAQNLPSKIVVDDGHTAECENLSGVTQRHITRISYTNSFPYGLPEKIETAYLDLATGEEKLLKTRRLFYQKWARPIREETCDAEGRLAFTKTWVYDRRGRVVEEGDPLGRKTLYTYDEKGNIASLTDPSGLFTTYFHYDSSQRLSYKTIMTCDGQKRSTFYIYTEQGQLFVIRDHLGNDTSFTYDTLGRRTGTSFPKVDSTEGVYSPLELKEYDLLGHETKSVGRDGSSTSKKCNFFGNPFEINHSDGTQEQFTYYYTGSLQSHTLPTGAKEEFRYDWSGRVARKKVFSPEGTLLREESLTYSTFQLKKQTDALGQTTFYSHDGAGRLIAEKCADRTIRYSYDSLGRLHKKILPDRVEVTLYDLLDRPIEERTEDLLGNTLLKVSYLYNALGLKSEERRETGEGISSRQWRYDPLGRVVEELDPLGNSTRIFYGLYTNSLKQKCQEITSCDPEGTLTIEKFDALERSVSKEKRSPFGITVSYESYLYDKRGNLALTETKILQEGSPEQVYRLALAYDAQNHLISRTEGAGSSSSRTTSYTYDPFGNLHKKILPSGVELLHLYDSLGNLKELISSDKTIHYRNTHDANGQLIQVEDLISGAISMRSYTPFGELLTDTLATGFTLTHHYDSSGRRKELLLPDATSIAYTYKGSLLHTISRAGHTHTYDQYDLSGNLLQETYINSKVTRYEVNKNGRRISDGKSRIESLSKTGAPLQEGPKTYTYDALGQLTSDSTHTYTHNSRYCRTSQDGQPLTTTLHGEILRTPTATYTYDKNGNCISKNQWQYTYDALGRLTKAASPTKTVTYTYDPWNRRLSKQTNNTTTYFLYDNVREIGAISNGKLVELRLLGRGLGAEIGATVAIELSGKLYTPHHDLQGNITQLIDPSGATCQELTFTPFGEHTGTLLSPWAFASKRLDPETELYFFGNRYYDPTIGSWLTPDPLDTPYPYAFANNNPLLYLDLYGFEALFSLPDNFSLGNFVNSLPSFPTYQPSFKTWDRYAWHNSTPYDQNLIPNMATSGMDCSFLYEKGSWEHSRIDFMLFNGVDTRPDEVFFRAEEASAAFGGIKVGGFYNASTGMIPDLFEASWMRLGGASRGHDLALFGIRSRLARIGKEGILFCLAHSKGGLELHTLLQSLKEEERRQIVVITFGSAYFFERRGYLDAINFVSPADRVSRLVNMFGCGAKEARDRNVTIVEPGAFFYEHGWNCTAYSRERKELFFRINQTIEQGIPWASQISQGF